MHAIMSGSIQHPSALLPPPIPDKVKLREPGRFPVNLPSQVHMCQIASGILMDLYTPANDALFFRPARLEDLDRIAFLEVMWLATYLQ